MSSRLKELVETSLSTRPDEYVELPDGTYAVTISVPVATLEKAMLGAIKTIGAKAPPKWLVVRSAVVIVVVADNAS